MFTRRHFLGSSVAAALTALSVPSVLFGEDKTTGRTTQQYTLDIIQYNEKRRSMPINIDGRKCMLLSKRRGRGEAIVEGDPVYGQACYPTFEIAAYPTWRRNNKNPNIANIAEMKAYVSIANEQQINIDILTADFIAFYGSKPDICMIPHILPIMGFSCDDHLRFGMVYYKEIGMIMFGH